MLIVEDAGIASVVQIEDAGSTDEGQNRTDGDLGINAGKPLFIAWSKTALKMSQSAKIKNAGQIIFCKSQAVPHKRTVPGQAVTVTPQIQTEPGLRNAFLFQLL